MIKSLICIVHLSHGIFSLNTVVPFSFGIFGRRLRAVWDLSSIYLSIIYHLCIPLVSRYNWFPPYILVTQYLIVCQWVLSTCICSLSFNSEKLWFSLLYSWLPLFSFLSLPTCWSCVLCSTITLSDNFHLLSFSASSQGMVPVCPPPSYYDFLQDQCRSWLFSMCFHFALVLSASF